MKDFFPTTPTTPEAPATGDGGPSPGVPFVIMGFVPLVEELAPLVKEIPEIVRGALVAAGMMKSPPPKKPKNPPKVDDDEDDNKKVIKLADAIKAVEDTITNENLVISVVQGVWEALKMGEIPHNSIRDLEQWADALHANEEVVSLRHKVKTALRKKVLQQRNPRRSFFGNVFQRTGNLH